MMRFIISVVFLLSFCTFVTGQNISKADSIESVNKIGGWNAKDYSLATSIKWYSQTINNGVIIQNSFPKGGPYIDSAGNKNGYSFLIFFTRVMNETATPLQLTINFPADSFAIPYSPNVFMKLFLPPDTMTLGKQILYNYGVTSLESFFDFNKPTTLQRTINPNEELLFYIGTVFYQASGTAPEDRGGNRAELILKGQDLFYRMTPQIDSLPCGHIILKK